MGAPHHDRPLFAPRAARLHRDANAHASGVGLMATSNSAEPDENLYHVLGARPDRCFTCGDRIRRGPFAYWHGMGGRTIFLHLLCAKELGCHLIRDAVNAEL